MVNNCLFINNVAECTAAAVDKTARGGAIRSFAGKLTVVDSIFKNNRAIQADNPSDISQGGGAIEAGFSGDVLVLSSVFELNEASGEGGAAQLRGRAQSVAWYNNKELVFGNDALDCDGAKVVGQDGDEDCFSVGDNFSF